jgi:hypothetical protein
LYELRAIPSRLEALRQQVAEQEKRQTGLQLKYKALSDELSA